ncbi:MAG: hypothetical protein ACRDS0_03845 [Pseudonocardiaceae bacterium]
MTKMSAVPVPRRRTQAWFPGVYVPIRHIHGVEIFEQPRGGVCVNRNTLHGTAAELRQLGSQLLLAAHRLERRDAVPPVSASAA